MTPQPAHPALEEPAPQLPPLEPEPQATLNAPPSPDSPQEPTRSRLWQAPEDPAAALRWGHAPPATEPPTQPQRAEMAAGASQPWSGHRVAPGPSPGAGPVLQSAWSTAAPPANNDGVAQYIIAAEFDPFDRRSVDYWQGLLQSRVFAAAPWLHVFDPSANDWLPGQEVRVTHLVVSKPRQGFVLPKSFPVLLASVLRAPFVSIDWIGKCVRARRIVEEDKHWRSPRTLSLVDIEVVLFSAPGLLRFGQRKLTHLLLAAGARAC